MALKSLSKVGQFTQKLNFQVGKLSVVIEPNLVLRGTLDQVHTRSILPSAEALFQKSTAGNVLSEEEVIKFYLIVSGRSPVKEFLRDYSLDIRIRGI